MTAIEKDVGCQHLSAARAKMIGAIVDLDAAALPIAATYVSQALSIVDEALGYEADPVDHNLER